MTGPTRPPSRARRSVELKLEIVREPTRANLLPVCAGEHAAAGGPVQAGPAQHPHLPGQQQQPQQPRGNLSQDRHAL